MLTSVCFFPLLLFGLDWLGSDSFGNTGERNARYLKTRKPCLFHKL